jgi:hypothetical protein
LRRIKRELAGSRPAWDHQHVDGGGSSEGAAARSERQLELLDRSLDGIAVVQQSDGTLVYANPALKALLGSGPEELAGALGEAIGSGRTDAVDLAHPDFGALRLIIVPRDARRAAERPWHRDLRRELARARRRRWPLTVGAIALDAGGSTQVAAAAWASVLRDEDSVTPHEAGVYLLVLPDCSAEAAQRVVSERVMRATPAPATASIGLAAWVTGEELESVVTRALGALADARAAGSNEAIIAPGRTGAPSV